MPLKRRPEHKTSWPGSMQLPGRISISLGNLEKGRVTSLPEYVRRMKEDRKDIYFFNGPSREVIEAGPYLEAFRGSGIEVIHTYDPIDDFVSWSTRISI